MDKEKTAADLYSATITEAAAALVGAGFKILSIKGLDTYTVGEYNLGTYKPDSVCLSFTATREPDSSS